MQKKPAGNTSSHKAKAEAVPPWRLPRPLSPGPGQGTSSSHEVYRAATFIYTYIYILLSGMRSAPSSCDRSALCVFLYVCIFHSGMRHFLYEAKCRVAYAFIVTSYCQLPSLVLAAAKLGPGTCQTLAWQLPSQTRAWQLPNWGLAVAKLKMQVWQLPELCLVATKIQIIKII